MGVWPAGSVLRFRQALQPILDKQASLCFNGGMDTTTHTPAPRPFLSLRSGDLAPILVVPKGAEFRVSEQTARYDSTVAALGEQLTFELSPIMIGGQPCSYEAAYWFIIKGGIPAVLKSGGYRDETPGVTRRTAHYQAYGYDVRKEIDALRAEHAADEIARLTEDEG